MSRLVQIRHQLQSSAAILALPASALLYFLLEVYLARALGADGFAQYAAFSAASGILIYVVSFGIPGASTKFVAEYQGSGEAGLLASYIRWSLAIGGVAVIGLSFPLAIGYVWLAKPAGLGFSGALAIAGATVGLFCWMWSRHVAIGAGITWLAVVPKELAFPIILGGVVALFSIESFSRLSTAYLVILLLIEVPVCVALWLRFGRSVGNKRERSLASTWLSVAFPLGLASLSSAGLARWDVVNATAILPIPEVAAYAAAARVALVGGIVQRAFEVVSARGLVQLRLSRGSTDVRLALRSQAQITGSAAAVMLGVVFIFADAILRLFGDFAVAGTEILRILIFAQLVHCVTAPYDVFMMVGDLQRERALLVFFASLAALVLTGVGAVTFGALGCAVAVLVTVSAYRIVGVYLVERHLTVPGRVA